MRPRDEIVVADGLLGLDFSIVSINAVIHCEIQISDVDQMVAICT